MTALTIVIPAYNEEGGIEAIARRVLAVKPELSKVGVDLAELLVVDDGSKDRTAEIARNIPGVTLIQHKKNKGYGGALKTGFSAAKSDLVGFLDADGTYPPEYFPQLCVKAMNGTDLVIGSRMAGAKSEMPPTRRLGNFLFANLLTIISNQRVTDSASGMRVFKREVLERMYPLPDGLNLTPVMSTRALHEGIRVAEVAIPYSERVGRSKLSVVKDGVRFLQSIVWTALSYNPVSILGKAGLVGVGIAALTGLWLVMARLTGDTTLGPLEVAGLFAALVAAVVGVSVFSLGVAFNYLVSLFYKQPVRQGLFGKPLFKTPLDRHFGWAGVLMTLVGVIVGIVSLALSLNGWEIARLWLYLLGSAMLTLIGIQLVIYWVLLRVLEELSQRDAKARLDMGVA
jgi:glycosyltransferase involved in cell wall biosynthesis